MSQRRPKLRWRTPALLALALSCRSNPAVTFDIEVAQAVAGQTTWFEIGAFRDGYCQAIKPMLGAGIPLDGSVLRLAFRRDAKATPALGDLPRARYAFAGVAKRDDCGVIATGCVEVDVDSERAVTLPLQATPQPTGACAAGAKCAAARCVPAIDNDSLGADCSLALLGAGPLGDALSTSGETVSGPSVVATPTGFLVAYREVDRDGAARLTLLPLDPGGGALPRVTSEKLKDGRLPGRCSDSAKAETDSAAMIFSGPQGTIALSRAPCGGSGGVDVFSLDEAGQIQRFGYTGKQGLRITLAPSRALASRPQGPLLAFTQEGQTRVANVVDGVALENVPTYAAFGGAPPLTHGWIAASDKALALLALGTGQISPPPRDAGGDAAREGGVDAAPPPSPPESRSLRLQIVPVGQDLSLLPTPIEVATGATWGSLAVTGSRVLVINQGTSESNPVDLHAFDLGKRGEVAFESIAIEGIGDATAGDIAIQDDRAFVAVVRQAAVHLVAYDRVTTVPTSFDPPRLVSFERDSRIPSIAKVRDGNVAVAATAARVAVVWTTASSITLNDPVGGYAIFACNTQ